MIQDIGNHRYDNAYRPAKPTPESYCLAFSGSKALMREGGEKGIDELELPRLRDWPEDANLDPRYLFRIDDQEFYLARPGGAIELGETLDPDMLPSGFSFESIQVLRTARPRWKAFGCVTACQLSRWYASNQFCGRCGTPLEHVATSRELACPSCGNVVYPRINPAIIVGITWGDRILLTKYASRAYTHYALVAGFMEIGEAPEDTIRREVMEEVGLHVRDIRYYGSQPWPFTDTVLLGYYADVDGDKHVHVDHVELKLGEWWKREAIRERLPLADDSSLTNEMITQFALGKEPRA